MHFYGIENNAIHASFIYSAGKFEYMQRSTIRINQNIYAKSAESQKIWIEVDF